MIKHMCFQMAFCNEGHVTVIVGAAVRALSSLKRVNRIFYTWERRWVFRLPLYLNCLRQIKYGQL